MHCAILLLLSPSLNLSLNVFLNCYSAVRLLSHRCEVQ